MSCSSGIVWCQLTPEFKIFNITFTPQKWGHGYREKEVIEVGPAYKAKGKFLSLRCPAVVSGRSHKLHCPWKGPFLVFFHVWHCDPKWEHLVILNPGEGGGRGGGGGLEGEN